MEVIINGEAQELSETISASELIDQLGLSTKRLAVEVNLEIVPRSQFDSHRFKPGDRIEIVHAIGGG
ncbi:MAG: sulfur carrier protein ThiS [Gammaproteobacteria bacterium]